MTFKLIKLTRVSPNENERELWVNPSHIGSVAVYNTDVYVNVDAMSYMVMETPAQIAELANGALHDQVRTVFNFSGPLNSDEVAHKVREVVEGSVNWRRQQAQTSGGENGAA